MGNRIDTASGTSHPYFVAVTEREERWGGCSHNWPFPMGWKEGYIIAMTDWGTRTNVCREYAYNLTEGIGK